MLSLRWKFKLHRYTHRAQNGQHFVKLDCLLAIFNIEHKSDPNV